MSIPPPPSSPYGPPSAVPAGVVPPVAPPTPAAPVTTDQRSVRLSAVGAVLFLSLAIGYFVCLSNFPPNAPIEQLYAFGITLDLLAVGVTLGMRFLLIRSRSRTVAASGPRPTVLAILGLVLALLAVLGWFPLGGLDFLGKLADGVQLRYYLDVGGAFFLGVPWVLGLIFGTVSLRPGRGLPNEVVATTAVVLGLVLLVPTVFSAVVYALGLSA